MPAQAQLSYYDAQSRIGCSITLILVLVVVPYFSNKILRNAIYTAS